jgi:hypothetical protein
LDHIIGINAGDHIAMCGLSGSKICRASLAARVEMRRLDFDADRSLAGDGDQVAGAGRTNGPKNVKASTHEVGTDKQFAYCAARVPRHRRIIGAHVAISDRRRTITTRLCTVFRDRAAFFRDGMIAIGAKSYTVHAVTSDQEAVSLGARQRYRGISSPDYIAEAGRDE